MSGSASEQRSFEVQACLGIGGHGEVYRAVMTTNASVTTEVALKVLRTGVGDQRGALERLRDEGRILGRLAHPNIVQFHALLLLDGSRHTLVTEYVRGADLSACLNHQPPIPHRCGLEALARVAEALSVAYLATAPGGEPLHLVHRDVKPSNVRLGRFGEVKLLDFGVAKVLNSAQLAREAKTDQNVVVGTVPYMAPERFDTTNDEGPASDVYSLGCTVYELLRGDRLFGSVDVKTRFNQAFDRSLHDDFVAHALESLSGSPPPLVELLGQMLAYEPADRPSAADVAHRLDEVAEELPGLPLRRWARQYDWPPEPRAAGELEGRVLSEGTLSGTIHTRSVSTEHPQLAREVLPTENTTTDVPMEEAPPPGSRGRGGALAVVGLALLALLATSLTLGGATIAVIGLSLRPQASPPPTVPASAPTGVAPREPPSDARPAENAEVRADSDAPTGTDVAEGADAEEDPSPAAPDEDAAPGSGADLEPVPEPPAPPKVPPPRPPVPARAAPPEAPAPEVRLTVTGDATALVFERAGGGRFEQAGASGSLVLPPGRYQVTARYPGGREIRVSQALEAPGAWTVDCRSSHFACRFSGPPVGP